MKRPFSRSCVLYWTRAFRTNGVAVTRRKRQKDQRERGVAREQQLMTHQKACENAATPWTHEPNQLKQPSRASFSYWESIQIRMRVKQFCLMEKHIPSR